LEFVPKAPKMTERNSVFKTNKQMLSDKTFVPEALQIANANLPASFKDTACTFNPTSNAIIFSSKLINTEYTTRNVSVNWLVYDTVKGKAICSGRSIFTVPQASNIAFDSGSTASVPVGTPEGSQVSDCRVYWFVTETVNDKELISLTFNAPVSLS